MSSDDLAYYREHARVERERALASSSADIAEIHEELARLYDALVEHESLRPTLDTVTKKVARSRTAEPPGRIILHPCRWLDGISPRTA